MRESASRPLVADSYNNIGGVYLQKGDLENALLQYQKALEVFLAVYGQEHRTSYKNIGIVYHHQGNVVEATEMYTKAYRIFHKVLGPDHPESLGLKSFVKEGWQHRWVR